MQFLDIHQLKTVHFLSKCIGYSQGVYKNAPVIVSVLNHFYQNAPVIVSALKALRDLYRVLSLRYLMSKTSEKSSPPQSASIMRNL